MIRVTIDTTTLVSGFLNPVAPPGRLLDAWRGRGKLTDPERLLDWYDLTATLPFEPHLRLDTTEMAPAEAAEQIARYYALP